MGYIIFGLLASLAVFAGIFLVVLVVSFVTWSWCFDCWGSFMGVVRLCAILTPVFSILAYIMVRD